MPPKKSRPKSTATRTGKGSKVSSARKLTSSRASARNISPKKSGSTQSTLSRIVKKSGVIEAAKGLKSSRVVKKVEKVMGNMLTGAKSGAASALEAVLPAKETRKAKGRK